jgi:hypothetical protein
MAELQFPNIVGNFLQGQQLGRARAAEDEARANQTRLGELAQLAYQAPADQRGQFIGEAVGINPEAGLALDRSFSQQDDAREQRLLSTARLIAAAPEEQKAAIFQQVRPQIAQYLPNLPETYNAQVGQGINAFIASRSGAGGMLGSIVKPLPPMPEPRRHLRTPSADRRRPDSASVRTARLSRSPVVRSRPVQRRPKASARPRPCCPDWSSRRTSFAKPRPPTRTPKARAWPHPSPERFRSWVSRRATSSIRLSDSVWKRRSWTSWTPH